MKQYLEKNPHFFHHTALALIWLLFLAAINQYSQVPIMSIFPFMLPVALIACTYGMRWGFVFAAVGTLAAMPGDYMQHHNMLDLYWAVFITYLKLSAAAVARFVLGKYVVNRRNDL